MTTDDRVRVLMDLAFVLAATLAAHNGQWSLLTLNVLILWWRHTA